MIVLLSIGAVLVIVGAALYLHTAATSSQAGQSQYAREEWARMPSELRTARLVASERDTAAWIDGAKVPARPDQIYCTKDARLVLVETKTRNQLVTHLSDIIELSVQHLAICQTNPTPGSRLADYAYVRIVPRGRVGKPTYRRVKLLSEEQIVDHYHRYQGIVAGDIRPTSQTRKAACSSCGQRTVCPAAL